MQGHDDLLIRNKVDQIYDKLLNTMFATLQQIAKTDRAEGQAAEDKGQLNYHVIMIGQSLRHCVDADRQKGADRFSENTHQLAEDLAQQPKLEAFQLRAQSMYEENLQGYNKLLIRRSFGRLMVRTLIPPFPGDVRLHRTTGLLRRRGAADEVDARGRSPAAPELFPLGAQEAAQGLHG